MLTFLLCIAAVAQLAAIVLLRVMVKRLDDASKAQSAEIGVAMVRLLDLEGFPAGVDIAAHIDLEERVAALESKRRRPRKSRECVPPPPPDAEVLS